MSFESDLKRMEEITELLKNEATGLEEAIKLYEEASALGKKLTKTLGDIQRRVEAVVSDSETELETEPFADETDDSDDAVSDGLPF